ncbi:hypothetical protein ACLOJK_025694 [Asimina triloba]
MLMMVPPWIGPTTEFRNDYMHMQPSACHGSFAAAAAPLLLNAFLTSCRAHTWDSKTQCIICLECLGAATASLLEGHGDDDKGGNCKKEKELEIMVC